MRGLPEEQEVAALVTQDVAALVTEGRFGRADAALQRLEALLPGLEHTPDGELLLLALYGRASLLGRAGGHLEDCLEACDVLERTAIARRDPRWVAVACAARAKLRVDAGHLGAATSDLSTAFVETTTLGDASYSACVLLDLLALIYARLRMYERLDEARAQLDGLLQERSAVDRASHWSSWSAELAVRAIEPVAMGATEPDQEMLDRAVQVGSRLAGVDPDEVPGPLRRGVDAVRALAAAYRGRPSEALRLLGQDAFGEARDLPTVDRQIATLAAMRAHAHVGSIASARSLDDGATPTPPSLVHLVLDVCRARERLWLETHAGGDVVPVLHRLTDLLVRLGWQGMDLVADTSRQALEHHALREESRTDALTGVGNRRALDEELRQLLRFSPLPLALVLVDIDDFKAVNDRFTHVVGDEVLRRVATSMRAQLRTEDRIVRYGGDEFVALLPGTGDEEAHRVARRVRHDVAARAWGELADGLHVTVSTGCAALWTLTGRRPDLDAERLFRRADEALLTAKRELSQTLAPASASSDVAEPSVPAAQRIVLPPIVDLRGQALPPSHGAARTQALPRVEDLPWVEDLPTTEDPQGAQDARRVADALRRRDPLPDTFPGPLPDPGSPTAEPVGSPHATRAYPSRRAERLARRQREEAGYVEDAIVGRQGVIDLFDRR